jgi:hypothetical protein
LCTCVASGCRVSSAWSPCSVLVVACSTGSRVGGVCYRCRSRPIAIGGCCVGPYGHPVASLPSLPLDPIATACRRCIASRRCCSPMLSLACCRSPGPTIAAAGPALCRCVPPVHWTATGHYGAIISRHIGTLERHRCCPAGCCRCRCRTRHGTPPLARVGSSAAERSRGSQLPAAPRSFWLRSTGRTPPAFPPPYSVAGSTEPC